MNRINEAIGFYLFVCLTAIVTLAVLATSEMTILGAILLAIVVTSGGMIAIKIVIDFLAFILELALEKYRKDHDI